MSFVSSWCFSLQNWTAWSMYHECTNEWVTSHVTHYRSFRSGAFPGNVVIMVHSTAQHSSDNPSSYPPDNQYSSDFLLLEGKRMCDRLCVHIGWILDELSCRKVNSTTTTATARFVKCSKLHTRIGVPSEKHYSTYVLKSANEVC